MKYVILFVCALIIANQLTAQTLNGKVIDVNQEPLIGATVLLPKSGEGTVTDLNGLFEITVDLNQTQIVISFIGYKTDTLIHSYDQFLLVQLKEDNSELNAVIIKSSPTFIDNLEPIHAEIITEKELLKAACCNLSESFETNASVDVSFTDAVSGTKTIRMLGLDGKYTLINRENLPNVRGLNSRQGLTFIPGTWIQSIDVGKGAGSVVNGYESISGQINIELKKPENGEKLYLNTYANSLGRIEVNANTSFKMNKNWSGALLTHLNYLGNEVDQNRDNFMDLPKSRQANILNRYKFQGERMEAQIGINAMIDEKAGGQLGFGFGDNAKTSSFYGYSSQVKKLELFGKAGFLFPEAPYKGWGIIYSGSYQEQNSGFGKRTYLGKEKSFYTNIIHQNIIGNTFHQIKAGASILVDDYGEIFADSTFARTEIVPGAFLEYTYLPGGKFTLVSGIRADIHNLYGLYISPRLHLRYEVMQEGTLRLSVGKGYRTSNIIAENNQVFISSRKLIVTEKINPEESWNVGGSFVKELNLANQKMSIVADYFHTRFQNQVITDLDSRADAVYFYNLDGKSYANSYQIEIGSSINNYFSTKAAYKFYNVKTTINGTLVRAPFVSRNRGFWNLSYASKYDIWEADFTLQLYGKQRLPNTETKPIEFQQRNYSPSFANINIQTSRTFRWGNIYLGSENLLDFKQDNPIVDAANPFSENFDGSLVWGPIVGRMIYFGIRYKIE